MTSLVRRVVAFALLIAAVGGYLHYRALERRARLVPQAARAFGTVQRVTQIFAYLNQRIGDEHERRMIDMCVKGRWPGGAHGGTSDHHQRAMRTLVRTVDEIPGQQPWDVLGAPAIEAYRRLTRVCDSFEALVDDVLAWGCTDTGIPETLARLREISRAWEECLGEFLKLKLDQVLDDGSPAFAACVQELPDSFDGTPLVVGQPAR